MTENETKYEGVIYSARSKTSGKYYVGQTTQKFEKRKADHVYFSLNDCHDSYNCHFHNAIRKYGEDDFVWTIEASISANTKEAVKDGLDWYESFQIQEYDSYHNGYNMTLGGGGALGWNHTEESKESIRKKMTGRDVSDSTRTKISKIHKGKHVSNETRMLLSKKMSGENHPFWGKNLSSEHIESLRKSKLGEKNPMYGKNFSDEHRKKISEAGKKEICQYSKLGHFIQNWDSALSAGEAIGSDPTHISSCCNGKRKSAAGYVWRFKGDAFDKYDSSNTSKRIIQFTIDGEFIREWDSCAKAGQDLNIKRQNISKCCKGLREIAGKFKWAYKES